MSPLQTDTLFLLPFPLHSFIENIAIDPLSYTSILSMQFSLSPDALGFLELLSVPTRHPSLRCSCTIPLVPPGQVQDYHLGNVLSLMELLFPMTDPIKATALGLRGVL